ncbi:MAG: hypothetical protein Q9187_006100, partial [Circinaria calcarea]
WMESLLDVRYPPYLGKLKKMQKMNTLSANFDRDGKVKVGLVEYILTLGTGSAMGASIGCVPDETIPRAKI